MIELLFLCLALSAAFVNESERLIAAIFTLMTLMFYFINLIIPDHVYYILSAGYDLLMMCVMYFFIGAGNQKLTKYLCASCVVSMFIQLIGWKIYVLQGNGHIYDYMAILFYVLIIALFLTRTKLNARFAGDTYHTSRFLRDHFRRA